MVKLLAVHLDTDTLSKKIDCLDGILDSDGTFKCNILVDGIGRSCSLPYVLFNIEDEDSNYKETIRYYGKFVGNGVIDWNEITPKEIIQALYNGYNSIDWIFTLLKEIPQSLRDKYINMPLLEFNKEMRKYDIAEIVGGKFKIRCVMLYIKDGKRGTLCEYYRHFVLYPHYENEEMIYIYFAEKGFTLVDKSNCEITSPPLYVSLKKRIIPLFHIARIQPPFKATLSNYSEFKRQIIEGVGSLGETVNVICEDFNLFINNDNILELKDIFLKVYNHRIKLSIRLELPGDCLYEASFDFNEFYILLGLGELNYFEPRKDIAVFIFCLIYMESGLYRKALSELAESDRKDIFEVIHEIVAYYFPYTIQSSKEKFILYAESLLPYLQNKSPFRFY